MRPGTHGNHYHGTYMATMQPEYKTVFYLTRRQLKPVKVRQFSYPFVCEFLFRSNRQKKYVAHFREILRLCSLALATVVGLPG